MSITNITIKIEGGGGLDLGGLLNTFFGGDSGGPGIAFPLFPLFL